MEQSSSNKSSPYPASILKKRDKSEPSFNTSSINPSSTGGSVQPILKRHSLPSDMENNNLYSSSRNDVEPTPILKKHSLSESSRDDMAPKSILKKKSSFEESSRHEKVRPILKKNKSTEEFDKSHFLSQDQSALFHNEF
ncbi:uncharacterized protein LOC141857286 [Brevipalpus obovatus]|uniref:uncharacterized protein LOC141857286 n=1 Tax=Brevipalpus obovatus TaxID=246614 RepID=UPI003D9DE791